MILGFDRQFTVRDLPSASKHSAAVFIKRLVKQGLVKRILTGKNTPSIYETISRSS